MRVQGPAGTSQPVIPLNVSNAATRLPAPPIDALSLAGLIPDRIEPPGPFSYDDAPMRQIDGLKGSKANAIITETYHRLDQAFTRYLGQPLQPNWLTFGKYASREAGEQITDLEAMQGARQGKWKSIKHLLATATHPDRLKQALSAGKALLLRYEGRLAAAGAWRAPAAQAGFLGYSAGQFDKLLASLVAGNTSVYRHIAPAFDVFMRAEAAGEDGLAALEQAGYGRGHEKDPQGFVLEAFKGYREARALAFQASRPDLNTNERFELVARRQALIERANLLMVVNEQWTIVQAPHIFGDPDIQRLTESAGAMAIDDATGSHPLLPDGGNWTDFATRMGFREVPRGTAPEAITIVDGEGVAHDYVVKPHEAREGTIFTYFEENLTESRSREMIRSRPAPLER